MRRYSTYLRQDQIEFLQNLSNASDFLREALDQFIKSDRGKTEKTIATLEGIQELTQKIKEQNTQIEETIEIDEDIETLKLKLQFYKKIADGQIEVKFNKEEKRYESFVLWDQKQQKITYGTNETRVKEDAIRLGKEKYDETQANIHAYKLTQAHKNKLKLLQKELEKLKVNL